MQNNFLSELGHALLVGSLDDERLMAQTSESAPLHILPEANVIKIGGQSFIDRGRAAVFPLIEEIVENLGRHQMIIGTGAGTRARHAYSVGLDLGLPTGVLSVLGTFVSMQNARILNYLLAKHGIPFIEPAQFAQLPHYLAERGAVIFFGMPPYIYWQQNPGGRTHPAASHGCGRLSGQRGLRRTIHDLCQRRARLVYGRPQEGSRRRSSSPRSASPNWNGLICTTWSSSAACSSCCATPRSGARFKSSTA